MIIKYLENFLWTKIYRGINTLNRRRYLVGNYAVKSTVFGDRLSWVSSYYRLTPGLHHFESEE
jgi:hypothetical protein